MSEQLQNELEEQARLLGMSAERECDLRGELERERALADRFGELLDKSKFNLRTSPLKDACLAALAAWKEARGE